jgi:MFS family permease
MNRNRFNSGIFVLEGLNAVSTAFYFNYLFFFLESQFGFTNFQNLLVCALNGFLYMFAAYFGGKIGQKHGYFTALQGGLLIMAAAMFGGIFLPGLSAVILLMGLWTFGVCLTWPNLEALICENQPRLPRMIGIYNVVWAGGGAVAYFSGGAIAEGLGWKSIYWIPGCIHLLQLVVVSFLKPVWKGISGCATQTEAQRSHPQSRAFLKMAWLANPFAYIAMNAAIPLIPGLANRLGLSPRQAGFFCSIWFFSRMISFAVLGKWERWHYRFDYLIMSYAGMLVCFAAMLLLNDLWLIVLAQVLFGWCVGLIYYSSLYYSMCGSSTKGEHGGVHEAAIGAGIFGGPAIGAASIYFVPQVHGSGIFGVTAALLIGLGGLFVMRTRKA